MYSSNLKSHRRTHNKENPLYYNNNFRFSIRYLSIPSNTPFSNNESVASEQFPCSRKVKLIIKFVGILFFLSSHLQLDHQLAVYVYDFREAVPGTSYTRKFFSTIRGILVVRNQSSETAQIETTSVLAVSHLIEAWMTMRGKFCWGKICFINIRKNWRETFHVISVQRHLYIKKIWNLIKELILKKIHFHCYQCSKLFSNRIETNVHRKTKL